MDSTKSNKINLTYMPHPFKAERIVSQCERKSFREIFEQDCNSFLPISHAIFIDKDKRITDYNSFPQTNDVIIKMVPEGDGGDRTALQDTGVGMKTTGAFLTYLGIGALVFFGSTGIGAAIGIALIGIGVSTIAGGVILYNTEISADTGAEGGPTTTPGIRGSQNKARIGQRVPILLGRHLLTPDFASLPYTTTDSNSVQYLHQLFCAGYNDMRVEESTFKVGDTPVSSYTGFTAPQVRYDSTAHTEFPERIIQSFVNESIEYNDHGESSPNSYVYTSASNTHKVYIDIDFPRGLFSKNDSGDLGNEFVYFNFEFKGVDQPDSSYTTPSWTKYGIRGVSAVSAGRSSLSSYDLYVKGATDDQFRITIYHDLDNDLPSDSDYVSGRTYTYRITPYTSLTADESGNDAGTIESVRSFTATFDDVGGVNKRPIPVSTQSELCTISFKTKASEQFKGVISNFNFIAQSYVKKYSGSGTGSAAWSLGTTSNPAAMFLYVLQSDHINPKPIDDDLIDWESLEEWYTFCDTKGFECNAYIANEITLKDLLNSICSTGRASWNLLDGVYTIIIDTTKSDVVQYFTPRNSWEFSGSKFFPDNPTVLKMNFINEDSWRKEERSAYKNEAVPDDSVPQSVDLFGVTNADQAWKIGRYMLFTTYLRPEVYSFNVDIEYIVCTRGDRIQVTHDVPLFGLDSGRIKVVDTSAGNTIGVTVDENLLFEVGTSYGITIRKQDGTKVTAPVDNPATTVSVETREITFTTPIIGTGVNIDDLFMFGESGSETVDLVIGSITPNDDLSATITAYDYAPAIFDSSVDGSPPTYNSNISKAGDIPTGISIGELPNQEELLLESLNTAGTALIYGQNSLSVKIPDSYELTSDPGFYPYFIDDDYFVFVNYAQGNKLYKQSIASNATPTAIGTVSALCPVSDRHGKLVYVNEEDGSTIYYKNDDDTLTGTQITTVEGWCPIIIDDDGTYEDIYYINPTDGFKIYSTTTAGGNGTAITGFTDSVRWMAYMGDSQITYTKMGVEGIWSKSLEDETDTGTLIHTAEVAFHSQYDAATIAFIDADNGILYRKPIGATYADLEGEPIYGSAWSVNGYNSNVIYSAPFDSGQLYYGVGSTVLPDVFLEGSENLYDIVGDTTINSKIIGNVDPDYLDIIAKNDFIYGSNIPDGSKVVVKGPTFFYIDQAATATETDAALKVKGTRIFLPANKVIVPGTVSAELLEATAINSKERASDGNYISEIDLDSGTQKYRKADGTVVLDFDPDRAGSELVLSGTIEIGSGSTGTDGNPIPTSTEVSTKAEVTYSVLASPPSGAVDGDIWIVTDKDNTELIYSSGTTHATGWIPSNWTTVSLQSSNFESGSAGWRILDSGDVEFDSGTFRGDLDGASGTITGGTFETASALVSGSTYAYAKMVGGRIYIYRTSDDSLLVSMYYDGLGLVLTHGLGSPTNYLRFNSFGLYPSTPVSLGTSSNSWDDGWFDGIVTCNWLNVGTGDTIKTLSSSVYVEIRGNFSLGFYEGSADYYDTMLLGSVYETGIKDRWGMKYYVSGAYMYATNTHGDTLRYSVMWIDFP